MIAVGYNRKIVKGKSWEISAIYDALFSARQEDLTDCIIFSTIFPNLDDMKLMIAVGISSLYFFGEPGDLEVVELMNELPKNLIPLEIIHLK